MSPMPIGASIAMMLSLIVALTLTPYLGYIFLREKAKRNEIEKEPMQLEQMRIYKQYYKIINPLQHSRTKRWTFMPSLSVLVLASMAMFYTKAVAVKMLPFDNKNEFQVVIDMPEGTTVERTAALTSGIGQYFSKQEIVRNYPGYAGTAGPSGSNG